MQKYELLYIVGTQYTDAEIGEIQAKIVALLEKSGAIILRNENLGKIRLAYSINKVRHGSYILVHFDAETSVIQTLNRQLGLTDEIVRHTLLIRAPGSENKRFELTAYIAPLSEEAKRMEAKPAPYRERVITRAIEEAPIVQAPMVLEKPMSIEELDKKLDEILEDDLSEKV